MMTIINSAEKLKELLAINDDWNIYDKVVQEFHFDERGFYCIGGECMYSDTMRVLRTLIVDKETGDIYRTVFNVDWCPEDQKGWIWSVLARQQTESIDQSKTSQKKRTREALANLYDTCA